MKNVLLTLLTIGLLMACNRTEKTQDTTTTQSSATGAVDAPITPKPQNCHQLVEAAILGKTNVYQESAKPISVSITVEADTTNLQIDSNCFVNNTATVRVTTKAGKELFKRTFFNNDLIYFSKNDEAIEQATLQNVTYKPSFNGQKYLTLTMQLIDPESRKKMDYELFINYYGEIVKVR